MLFSCFPGSWTQETRGQFAPDLMLYALLPSKNYCFDQFEGEQFVMCFSNHPVDQIRRICLTVTCDLYVSYLKKTI